MAAPRGRIKFSARKEVIEQQRLRQSFERKLSFSLINQFAEIGSIARTEYLQRQAVDLSSQLISQRIALILEPHYRTVIEAFGLRMLREQKQESQFETLIRSYYNVFGLEAVRLISLSTSRRLLRVMIANELDGLGVAVIADSIFEAMRGQYAKNRAAVIARTETHNAASYANNEVAKTMNIPDLEKQWVSVSDDRTRSAHAAMNGVVVPMDEDFQVPSDFGPRPMSRPSDPRGGPANTINCRCVLLYITPEDEVVDE